MSEHQFTFGQNHTSSFELSRGFELSDYWVSVILTPIEELTIAHRDVFIKNFTKVYCPRPLQFSFEYDVRHLIEPEYFPGGELIQYTGADA